MNISAMSFGSLSAIVRALNKGAQLGGFYHDTGEGSLSPLSSRKWWRYCLANCQWLFWLPYPRWKI